MSETDMGGVSQSPDLPFWDRDLMAFVSRKKTDGSGKTDGRKWLASWSLLMYANGMTRREAKALLFCELAEAARQGMPLELALQFTMRTTDEIFATMENPRRVKGADNRFRKYSSFILLLYFFTLNVAAYYLLFVGSAWSANIERVARIQARRLLPWMEHGLSFSQAMKKCGSDFTQQEIAMIEAGESLNQLPQALHNMSAYHLYENRVQKFFNRLAYPIFLIALLLPIDGFILIFILPKMVDIYHQFGAELPEFTRKLIHVEWIFTAGPASMLLSTCGSLLISLFLLRCSMNGNRIFRNVQAIFFTVSIGYLLTVICLRPSADSRSGDTLDAAVSIFGLALLFSPVILILITPFFMRFLERLVLAMEKTGRVLFGKLPFVGSVLKQESRARWLASISMSLEAGLMEVDAIRIAGKVAGGSFLRKSEKAAQLAAQGISLAKTCEMAGLLPPKWTNRLALFEGSPDFTRRFAGIANDANDQSFEMLNRASRIAEVSSVVIIAIIIGAFVVAVYMPLLSLPVIFMTK